MGGGSSRQVGFYFVMQAIYGVDAYSNRRTRPISNISDTINPARVMDNPANYFKHHAPPLHA